jgi:N-methylhydantoinase B
LTDGSALDGVRLAVLANRFEAIVRSMVNTLVRTGRSGVLNTGRDFSCCLLTGSSELLVLAESLPIHVMSGPDLMAEVMKEFHPTLRRGDAFLHNSPYHGNSHAADHSLLVPVIDDEGVHRFTVVAKAHQADCGNSVPTTYFAAARDVYEEGALIFPCVKVQEGYADCPDVIRMCKLRIRVPKQWHGDYLALLGAARIAERLLLELADEVGWDTLERYARAWLDYSEQQMVAAVRALPSGRITVHGGHDPFPGVPEGVPIAVTVDVSSDDAVIEVDLRDNPDCQPCGLNLTEATARTAAMMGVFYGIGANIPANAGSARRLRIHLRENCVVGIPRHPASCSVATTALADRVTNCVQRALAELAEGHGLAEAGLVNPPALAVVSGRDPRAGGEPFVNQLILSALTGGPGAPTVDGWLSLASIGSAGIPFRDSVELDELRFPILVDAQRIIPDSEGAGRFRGAPGAYCEYGPLDCDLEVLYISDGSINPARGVRGGWDGARARQYRRDRSGELVPAEPCGHLILGPDETIVSMSCGGGGYGPPHARDPRLVRRDVHEGWISRERAERVYAVVLNEEGELDVPATRALRECAAIGSTG